ncbi:hypothetical protein [Streptomyces canus]|uniref:hypothetical protein n=1 Tax=Streptomyces canus TaxID=58343 RepID=UPI003252D281
MGGGRGGALLLRGVGKYTSDRVCRAIVGRPTRSMPSLMDCASSPEGQHALTRLHRVGDPEKLGVLRLNWRTSDRRERAAFKEMICADHTDAQFLRVLEGMQTDESMTAYADRAVGRATTWGRRPHPAQPLHGPPLPERGPPGSPGPTRVTDVLHGLPL